MGGKPDEAFAVGSAVTVEQFAYVTGVFGIGVNVGAGEAVGVAAGADGAQEVRRRKDKSKKMKAKSFFVCTSSPYSMSTPCALSGLRANVTISCILVKIVLDASLCCNDEQCLLSHRFLQFVK